MIRHEALVLGDPCSVWAALFFFFSLHLFACFQHKAVCDRKVARKQIKFPHVEWLSQPYDTLSKEKDYVLSLMLKKIKAPGEITVSFSNLLSIGSVFFICDELTGLNAKGSLNEHKTVCFLKNLNPDRFLFQSAFVYRPVGSAASLFDTARGSLICRAVMPEQMYAVSIWRMCVAQRAELKTSIFFYFFLPVLFFSSPFLFNRML